MCSTRAVPRHRIATDPSEDFAMLPQIASRPDTTTQIIRLVRFAVLCTLALAAVLLLADLLGRGLSFRFLTENVVMSLVYAIAAEVIAAIAAATCLALWK